MTSSVAHIVAELKLNKNKMTIMHGIKIRTVALLTGGFFLMIFLHYDVFGFSSVDTIENINHVDVTNITKNLTTQLKPGPRDADMVLKNQDEMIVYETSVGTVNTTNNDYYKKPYLLEEAGNKIDVTPGNQVTDYLK